MALIKIFDSDTLQSHHWSRLGTLLLHSLMPSLPHGHRIKGKDPWCDYAMSLHSFPQGVHTGAQCHSRELFSESGFLLEPLKPMICEGHIHWMCFFLKDGIIHNQILKGTQQLEHKWCASLVKSLLQAVNCLHVHHCGNSYVNHGAETMQNSRQFCKLNSFHFLFLSWAERAHPTHCPFTHPYYRSLLPMFNSCAPSLVPHFSDHIWTENRDCDCLLTWLLTHRSNCQGPHHGEWPNPRCCAHSEFQGKEKCKIIWLVTIIGLYHIIIINPTVILSSSTKVLLVWKDTT